MKALEITDLRVSLGDVEVLRGVSWGLEAPCLAAIIGPNGGGKSTLLRVLVGMERAASGTVSVLGTSPRQARLDLAYLPQSEEVDWSFPISVREVVMQGRLARLGWMQRPRSQDWDQVYEALSRVGLNNLAHRPIGHLSGGQKQRVFIARAIAQNVSLILFDEPANGLDAPAQHEILDLAKQLKSEGKTVVITTHDLNCLTDRFDQVLCLNREVVAAGPPQSTLSGEVLTRLYQRHIPLVTPTGEVGVEHC